MNYNQNHQISLPFQSVYDMFLIYFYIHIYKEVRETISIKERCYFRTVPLNH